ncbi:hypothetical protein KUCAC02_022654 [Chaenocephalus aceratus]|uniref:Uncharacterized protein n=1 Tax=Chaenocephalus aceratus TaxID=36190 RepID=A0ACB9XNE6_CHAAC|nr:hypothetical protein KUCAC02_022654 [Chaenocephalus aceratus]
MSHGKMTPDDVCSVKLLVTQSILHQLQLPQNFLPLTSQALAGMCLIADPGDCGAEGGEVISLWPQQGGWKRGGIACRMGP